MKYGNRHARIIRIEDRDSGRWPRYRRWMPAGQGVGGDSPDTASAVPGEVTQRAAKTVAASVVAETLGKVGTFVFVLLGARMLTQAEFGAFSYALAAATLLAAIPQWGFDSIVVRDASQDPSRLGVLLGETWVWRLVLSVPVILGAALFGAFTRPDLESGTAFVLVVGAALLDALTQTGRAAAVSRQRYGGVALAHVVQRLTTAILGAVALAIGLELVGFSSAFFLGAVIGAIGVGIAVHKLAVRVDLRAVTRRGLARLWRDSFALGLDLVLSMAVLRIDALLLGGIKGDEAVATYSVVTRVVETVLFLAWAVQHGLFPVMSASVAVARVRAAIERGMAVVAVAYVPFFVVMLLRGGEVVGVLFGSRYEDAAAAPAAWLAAAPLLIALGNLVSHALIARRRTRQVVIGTLAALVVNILLNLALIPAYGAEGAALATTAAYAAECALLLVLCARVVGFPRLEQTMAPSVAAGAVMALVVLGTPGGLAGELVLGSIAFFVVWLILTRWWAPDQLAVIRTFIARREPPSSGDSAVPSALDDL
jgi:O-antigen/teichoic acid export membrane protein